MVEEATRYANTHLPNGRLATSQAAPTGTVGSLTQDWLETFLFNGIGNISRVDAQRNTASGNTRPGRYEKEWYTPETPASGQALDRVVAVGSQLLDLTKSPPEIIRRTAAATPGSTSYSYDLLGHLTRVTRTSGESETLAYAPGGELVSRQVGERFIFYLGEYATVTASGLPGCGSSCVPQASTVEVDAHVVFAGTRIASVKPSRTLYYYRTRLGTVVATSLGGGVPGAGYRHTAYGEVELSVNETEASRSELGYTNALRLTGSLLYLKNRVYDAEARVFIQPDTVDRLRYAYVWGDPVNLSDPSGLAAKQDAPRIDVWKDGTLVRVVVTSSDGSMKVVAAWDTQTPVSAESAKQMANQIGLALDAVKTAIGAQLPGTRAGEYAVNFYNKIINDPNSSAGMRTAAYIGRFFAGRWTRETAVDTAVILGAAAVAATEAAATATAHGAAKAVQPACAGPCGDEGQFRGPQTIGDGSSPGGERVTQEAIERAKPGADGARSRMIIERMDGETISTTHQVTKEGQIVHQHQEHVGKYGTVRRFPDEWTGTKTVNAPEEKVF